MKRKICLILSLIIIFSFGISVRAENITLKNTNNYWELIDLIEKYETKRNEEHERAELAREWGYAEDSAIIANAQGKWNFYNEIVNFYQEQLKQVKSELSKLEYQDATLIWEYLHYKGLNDYVSAGIIGNMMAEVGGGTLDLMTCANTGNGFYGLCQWSQTYCKEVWGEDLKGQLDYLMDTMQEQFDLYGFVYSADFDYESFLGMQNEQQSALAFMKCYERGLPYSNYARQQYATVAYEYFTSN